MVKNVNILIVQGFCKLFFNLMKNIFINLLYLCIQLLYLHIIKHKHKMKKQQFNTVQKVVYIILTVLAVLTILNFFSFGFLFAWAFGFIGTGLQVVVCFASLLFGSWAWAENEIADEKYTF